MWRWLQVGMYLLFGLFGVVLCVALIAVAINFYDPPINPAAAIAFKASPPVPDEDNLYLALQGLNAPEGSSLTAYGRIRNAEYRKFFHQIRLLPQGAPIPDFIEPHGLQTDPDMSWCKVVHGNEFWDAASVASTRNNGFKDATLLRRYLHLSDFKHFYVSDKSEIEVPWVLQDARCQFSAYLIGEFSSAKLEERIAAIRALGADIIFWRSVMRADLDLPSAAIAVLYSARDWAILAAALDRRAGLAADVNAEVSEGLPWSKDADWSLRSAFMWEGRKYTATFEEMAKTQPKGWYDRFGLHFFKLNASTNLFYEFSKRYVAAADAPPQEMVRRFEEADQWTSEHRFGLTPRMLYNPFGVFLTDIAWGWQQSYSLAAMDSAALEKMTQLSYEVHLKNIRSADVPAFISCHPELGSHPVSGTPFTFDTATTVLSFVPVTGKQYHGTTEIRLFK